MDRVNVTFRSILEEDATIVCHIPEAQEKRPHDEVLKAKGEVHISAYHSHVFTVELQDGTIVQTWMADRREGPYQVVHVDRSLSVLFENRKGEMMQVFWVSPAGDKVPSGTLAPRSKLHLDTTTGHKFQVERTDGSVELQWVAAFRNPVIQHVVIGERTDEL